VPEAQDTETPVEITFWAKNDSNKRQVAIYKNAISEFEALYPNIKVNLRLYTDYGKIYNDVITNIATGTTPNVCITYPDHIATYISGQNIVVPLEELMEDPRYGLGGSEVKFDSPRKEEIVPEFLSECSIAGHTYALPFMRSTEAIYINKDYVNKLGYELPDILTWDFLFEVSEAAVAKNPDGTYALNGQNVMIPCIYKSTDNMMISMLKQKGAPYSDEEGNILIFNDETKALLREIAKHGASGAFSTFSISSYPGNFLNAGQCVFAIDSTAGATWMGPKAPLIDIHESALVDFELAIRPVPQFDPSNPRMISQGPSVCVFNKKDPQEVLASWLFTQYLLTNGVQNAYAETEGYVPVTLKARNSEEYQDYVNRAGEDNDAHYFAKIEAARLLTDNTANTFVTPVFNGSASLRSAAGALIEETVKSERRGRPVDDKAIDGIFEKTRSLYRLDQGASAVGQKAELGPLPSGAKALLISLAAVWILIAAYYLLQKRSAKKPYRG
ncbi:MAG: extracellular solute-binding protein, partial [Lachnospiraceae bacterium]|nr:extracellular solute-binding protein [Lachnospiraceae bacterium]